MSTKDATLIMLLVHQSLALLVQWIFYLQEGEPISLNLLHWTKQLLISVTFEELYQWHSS